MRITSFKKVHFTSSEMKEAIIEYIRTHYGTHAQRLLDYLRKHELSVNSSDDGEFIISIKLLLLSLLLLILQPL